MTQEAPSLYDRNRVRLHRDRAARMIASGDSDDFLYTEIADRLADCLADVKRQFPRVLDLGCRTGNLWPRVRHQAGQDLYLQTDMSAHMIDQAKGNGNPSLVLDEEALLESLPDGTEPFDLVLAGGGLHWVNDLPGILHQVRRVLKPDGLFLAALISGDTLITARHAMIEAEQQIMGGVSPRFNPSFALVDAAGLLQRAGFALPVADISHIKVEHSHPLKLIKDLRAMGETNAHCQSLKCFSSRRLLPAFCDELQTQFEAKILSQFDLMILSGWAPHASQQQPLQPGSGKTSLEQVLSKQA